MAQWSQSQLEELVKAGRSAEQIVEAPAFIDLAESLLRAAGNELYEIDLSGPSGPHNAVYAVLKWRAAVDFGTKPKKMAEDARSAREELQRREQVERERASKSDGRSQGKPRT